MIHHHRCDYSLTPVPADAECYCPAPGEEPKRCGHLHEVECECADYETEGSTDIRDAFAFQAGQEGWYGE